MAAPADYPFATWETYYAALSESFSTEFYGETYPAYKVVCDTQGSDADLHIIQALLNNGASPQEGFNQLLRTCIVSHRYSPDFILYDNFSHILQAFFDRGVQFDIDTLLRLYVAEEPGHFEEEAYTCQIRGWIICELVTFVPDLLQRLDDAIQWQAIDPVYWEDAEEPVTMEQLRRAVYSAIKHTYLEVHHE